MVEGLVVQLVNVSVGDWVQVMFDDYGWILVIGEFVGFFEQCFLVCCEDEEVGEVVVYFFCMGFLLNFF